MNPLHRTLSWLAAALVVTLASGCGGGGGGSSPAPEPDPAPIARDDTARTNEDLAVTVDVLANDANASGGSFSVNSPPANGTAHVAGNRIVYTPDPGFSGTDTFTYELSVAGFAPQTATVTITIDQAPIANDDSFVVIQDTPTLLTVLANDTGHGELNDIEITAGPNGDAATDGTAIRYTPPEDFIGIDTFRYRVTNTTGATSNEASVTVTIEPVSVTALSVLELPVPMSDYDERIDPASGGVFLSSPLQSVTLPPNTVSFYIALTGEDVSIDSGLYLSHVIGPNGPLEPIEKEAVVCDSLLCTAYQPRKPGQTTTRGEWQFRVGTRQASIDDIDFSNLRLRFVARSGPDPEGDQTPAATLPVRPFLTASSVTAADFAAILAEFVSIAAANGITVDLRPTIIVDEPQFEEVSSEFGDPVTAELVGRGDADAANLFFIESFTGLGGRIGIAPGIPGTQGIAGPLNGVIINATVTRDDPEIYIRTTAEFAFHEMGHLLGLFHTTEANFTYDVLDDTPECTRNDTTASTPRARDCPDGLNPMFWTNEFGQEKTPMTGDQKFVIYHAPIAAP